MQVFRTDAVGELDLASQLRVKPTGLAAFRAGVVDFARRKPVAAVGGVVLAFVIIVAIFAPYIAPHSQEAIAVATKFSGPLVDGAPLGTDQLGRDILSRLIHGARISMYVGVVSTFIGISLGTIFGIASAYIRRQRGPHCSTVC